MTSSTPTSSSSSWFSPPSSLLSSLSQSSSPYTRVAALDPQLPQTKDATYVIFVMHQPIIYLTFHCLPRMSTEITLKENPLICRLNSATCIRVSTIKSEEANKKSFEKNTRQIWKDMRFFWQAFWCEGYFTPFNTEDNTNKESIPEQRDQYGLFLEFSINYSNAVRHERKRETF